MAPVLAPFRRQPYRRHCAARTANPCQETAIKLIEYDREEFARYFTDNKVLLGIMTFSTGLNKEYLSNTLHINTNTLLNEPEFKEMCDIMGDLDDPDILDQYNRLGTSLEEKGYTAKMRGEAFTEVYGSFGNEY
ncbi:MAG: hypothetical protein ACR2P9_01050 [Gammaproteobacteria bacterium]